MATPEEYAANIERARLTEEAEVRKRLLSDCKSRVQSFYDSKCKSGANWDVFSNKFRSMGLKVPSNFINCKICEEPFFGHYFQHEKQIVLCANNTPPDQVNTTLTHEVNFKKLVHVFDDARAELDFKDPEHVACSEIRAINLSSECRPGKITRFWSSGKSYVECVQRKSILSLIHNKLLGDLDEKRSTEAVLNVWDICYHDYEPFTYEEYKKKQSRRQD